MLFIFIYPPNISTMLVILWRFTLTHPGKVKTYDTPTPRPRHMLMSTRGVNVIFDWLKLTAITAIQFVIG